MARQRVAITGLGIVSPAGLNLGENWETITNGRPCIRQIQSIDTSNLAVKIAGTVENFELSEELLSAKEQPRYDRFIHFAIHAINEALTDAGLKEDWQGYERDMVGCILGVGMGGFPLIEINHKSFLERGPRRVSPFFIPAIIPNMASGLASIIFGIKGVNYTVSSACASSSHSISAAALEIMNGSHDVIVTGGCESVVANLTIAGFSNMKALSKRNDDPMNASRPFDQGRDGFVMGEGSGILVLENYDKAVARGAKIYAEVAGFASTSDAYHITAPHPEGEGASLCMSKAVKHAGIDPTEVDYINAHGTSTPLGDIGETKAIKKTFGDHAYDLNVSSTKSMIGHLLGAAGGVESLYCVMAVHTGVIPPTANLENPDPECDLNYTALKSQTKDVRYALNNSFGFGGTNSSLIFKKV